MWPKSPVARRSALLRSCPVADALGAPVFRDQGPDGPAGHGKADQCPEGQTVMRQLAEQLVQHRQDEAS
jgi:hypothetical protein